MNPTSFDLSWRAPPILWVLWGGFFLCARQDTVENQIRRRGSSSITKRLE